MIDREKVFQCIAVAMKMKRRMQAKKLRNARAYCPICEGGMLNAALHGRRDHIHIRCSTPHCVALIE